jgi:hypothetical protein
VRRCSDTCCPIGPVLDLCCQVANYALTAAGSSQMRFYRVSGIKNRLSTSSCGCQADRLLAFGNER